MPLSVMYALEAVWQGFSVCVADLSWHIDPK